MNAAKKPGTGLAVWGLAGGLITLGAISLGTLAWLTAVILLLAALIFRVPPRFPALFMGAALPLLLVAGSNLAGPGWSCWSGPNMSGCDQLLNPWPFLLVAVALLVMGLLLHLIARGRHR